MSLFLQLLIQGLMVGAVYALVALGFVLIYKATEVVNFAQGDLMMIGAYIYFSLVTSLGMTPLLAFGATLVLAGGLGALIERLVLHPLVDEPPFTLVMVTIGLSTVLRAATGMIWSHDTYAFPSPIPESAVHVGEVAMPLADVWTIAITVVLSLLLFLFFTYTRLGTAMRAVAQNRYAAQLMGISVDRIFTLTWALAAALGAIGGMLLADISMLHTNMGYIGLKAFPAVVLGGMESIPGALLGGVVIGLIESLAGVYLDPVLGGGTHQVVAFVILLVVLMLKPAGLFGATLEKRV